MKGGARKKEYTILLAGLYIILPAIGWYFSGFFFAVVGMISAYLVDCFFPKWKYALTWKDIDLALNNLYEYGRNPSELCFRVGERRVFVYRDEKGREELIRMAVCIPLADWLDLYSKEDLRQLLDKYGGQGLYSNNRGPESYDIFTKKGQRAEGCKEILRALFIQAVGGLRSEILAQGTVNTYKKIWKKHSP